MESARVAAIQMPEQQASPSSSQSQHDDDTTRFLEYTKRTYLSLLPPPQLIDLILAIDANRQTLIFPPDLDSAIKALQRPQRTISPASPKATPPAASVVVKAESVTAVVPPPQQNQNQTPPTQASPPVPPPQFKPHPPPYKPPQGHPGVYPYTHTPYYPTLPPPPPPQQTQSSSHVSAPSAPPRNSPFTSAPLTRDPNRPPVARPIPPPPLNSRDDPNAMPSYEEMICEAIMDLGEADGTAPKVVFAWMASHYPLQQNFRPSASQALHKAFRRGRLEKIGGKYRLNPSWGGGPTTSKRATRRPTANGLVSHVPTPPPSVAPPPNIIPPQASPPYPHPPYGYAPYGHHLSMPLAPPQQAYPYGMAWGGVPPMVGQVPSVKANDVEEEDGVESDDMEGQTTSAVTETEERKKELAKLSLVRLARVLKRFAKRRVSG